MRDLVVLLIHFIASLARLLGPGGARSLVAVSLLLKHQLLILNRSRQRAPNLSASDRILAGWLSLWLRPTRLLRSARERSFLAGGLQAVRPVPAPLATSLWRKPRRRRRAAHRDSGQSQPYSVRSACIGSTPAARRAGKYAAAMPPPVSSSVTAPIVHGSFGLTP